MVLFAASSVADVLREIADRFEAHEGRHVVITQGASGKLCKQLEIGAPCDVYLPADSSYLDRLQSRNIILGATRKRLAANELVVVQAGRNVGVWAELSRLSDVALGPIAVASPDHSPAGRYARKALKRAGLWNRLRARMVYADNVRLAARYVANGGIKVGIVYATDALAFADRLLAVYRFPRDSHAEILYEAAVCKQSTNRTAAATFLEFAASASAEDAWRRHGFARLAHGPEAHLGR